MNIMIVEDDAIIASHLAGILEGFGHTIIAMLSSGEEAIGTADKHPPDLVLMDLRLRGEMDGVETGRELNRRFGVPIIFLSAFPLPASAKLDSSAGFLYLSKPVEEMKLREAIESLAVQSGAKCP